MSIPKPLQHKKHFVPLSAVSSFPSLRPARPLASRPTPAPEQAQLVKQEQLDHAARFGHSFERISLFPPEHLKKNNTGLPDTLKSGIESISNVSMDDVQVYHNSSKPATLQALAYAQGTDIHVGPGQERHLAHEAWHVVQQKQGRVKPTLQAMGLVINDDTSLEQEADTMGAKAMQREVEEGERDGVSKALRTNASPQIVQRFVTWTETRQNVGSGPFLVGEAAKVDELEDLLNTNIDKRRLSTLENALGIQSLETAIRLLIKSDMEEVALPREDLVEAAERLMSHLEARYIQKEVEKKGPTKGSKPRSKARNILLDLSDDTDIFNKIGDGQLVNPNIIKFSQDTAGFFYTDAFVLNGKTIKDVKDHAAELEADQSLARSTPAIEIVLYKKRIMTLNNRRLKAHRLAGVEVPVKKSALKGDNAISKHPNVDAAAPRNDLTLR